MPLSCLYPPLTQTSWDSVVKKNWKFKKNYFIFALLNKNMKGMKNSKINSLAREIADAFVFSHIRPEVQFHVVVRREHLTSCESVQLLNLYKSLL